MSEMMMDSPSVKSGVALYKKLDVMIRPGKLDAVKKAMTQAGYTGVTVTQADGHGNQKGAASSHDGATVKFDLLPKIKLEVVVKASDLEPLIEAISRAAATGMPGDGKIFVSDVQDVVRIRTGERGPAAL